MEEDDEFGDLYTDVFPSISSAPPPPPPQSSPAPQRLPQASSSTLPLSSRPIDLNLKFPDDQGDTPSASDSRALAPLTASIQGADARTVASSLRVSDPSVSAELPKRSFQDAKLRMRINLGAEAVQEVNKGADFMDTDVKFDIEEADADPDNGPLAGMIGSRQSTAGDDWDSDSEDELQIVLNENPPLGPMGMFGDGADDDDGDEDPLVIVADGDPNQATEATEWGEDAGQTGPDGERKEPAGGEVAKTSGAVAVAPKVGYSSHGYHPFHSQFKYVRPGAAPIPGANAAGPGGVQVRPPMNVGAVAGRGRGEWRPPGIRPGAPFQKNYQAGFGPPTWGSGRGFGGGGLDFTLPSHKTIFEVDIDSFEKKPWKYPGVDMTDFFNFGLNEESWKDYSKQLGQHRLQTTMQSRIRVHEGVRTEQEYDPDMPPELAAATGNQDVRSENANVGKADAGQIDPNAPPPRPPIPAGRPIQVEIASVERLPSMETRPPRFRDSDAIEIELQGSLDDNSTTGQGDEDHHDNGTPTNNVDEDEDDKAEKESLHEDNDNSDTSNDKNKESTRRASLKSTPDSIDKVSPQVPAHLPPVSSRSQIPVYGDGINEDNRRNQGRRTHQSRSPYESPAYSAEDKRSVDIREGSTESMERKSGARQLSLERNDVSSVSGDRTSEVEKKDMALDEEGPNKTPDLESKLPSREEDLDDGENSSRAARSSENSKGRSGSSREYQKRHGDYEEEVLQTGRPMRITSNRSNSEADDYRRRRSDEVEKNHRLVVKGGREAASYKDMAIKSEGLDRRRERDRYYDKVASSQWRDDDPQGRGSRAEETRKRDRTDDVGSRHRSRKEMDNGLYEVNFDKDLSSRPRDRDDGYPHKRKKEEHVRRDYADNKEEIIQHGNRESMTRQKREREREDSDDHYSGKHRDDIPMHRERGEKQKNRDMLSKPRQTHDEDVPKRDREVPGSRGRGAEDKPRVAHGRSKDEYRVSDKDYQYKDTSRQTEQVKIRDRAIVDESKNHHRGRDDVRSRGMVEDKRSRPERLTSRGDRSTSFPENQKMHEREHRESTRKNKESEAGDNNAAVASKRKRDDQTYRVADRGLTAADGGVEEASSDDEQSDSRRGRSKMERWTSHKERELTINSKPSSSLKMKELGRSSSSNGGRKEHPPKAVELDAVAEETEVNAAAAADVKLVDKNKLLDTVEKLKKRSERFKLPLPIEKEGQSVKKTDIEALPCVKNEAPSTDTETKHERPARKRRWISG